jgi:hypothetical protein
MMSHSPDHQRMEIPPELLWKRRIKRQERDGDE